MKTVLWNLPNNNLREEPGYCRNNDILIRCFNAINKKYFKHRIDATIDWGIPKTLVTTPAESPPHPLTTEELSDFTNALELIACHQLHAAATILKPLARGGHKDSQLALTHILKRTQGDWATYAKMYNKRVSEIKTVPAAYYCTNSRSITIHTYLYHREAPQFVLRYLIYKQCCYQLIMECKKESELEHLKHLKHNAPHEERAINWLEKQGFHNLREH